MAVNTENIRRWIECSDIDYISHFIKAWIPFNAWFNAEYSDLKSDREKINKIKNDSNSIRNKFNSLMEGDGQENKEFHSFLASLHNELQNTQIESKDGRIWFTDIVKSKNPNNKIEENFNRIKYFLKREDKQRLGKIQKIEIRVTASNGNNLLVYEHNQYDFSHLQSNSEYIGLSNPQQAKVRLCFERLKPVLIDEVLEYDLKEDPKNYYNCDSIHFVRDSADSYCPSHIMCKCLIETLYQLRNVLFHGKLIPNADSQKVYKNAYFCLKYLLEALK